ncbi:hypothetical protein OOK41_25085 [Micromonospora sp. NBC_01655]|uniref:hypothetical protein n=1 Tax=Micromonospora sp. NBC_01655 TaxID=2975983 RepID=UPI002250B49C|nr:hypothetical protein [Micromonospora sp. NBC_01655]MCX4473540.1 hypothetical protein [Micromonospora sp. NBC_01655]
MWPWRRRSQGTAQRSTADASAPPTVERFAATTSDASQATASREDASREGASPGDGSPAHLRNGPPAWQSLPPLQRVTPDEPRLNLPDTFTGALAAWRNPSYLAPLGHLVGAAEPAGVLHETAVPVSEPPRPAPEPVGRARGGDPGPLPLAAPSAGARTPAPALQRQVAGAPGTPPTPEHPLAVPTRGRAVPVEPVTVSRLLTAPPPPEELLLPAVDRPADPTAEAARPDDASPEAPTLGRDDPTAGDADVTTLAGTTSPLGGDVPGPTADAASAAGPRTPGGTGPAAPDLPVQRLVGAGPRPPRRLGLGEPIVSPVLPPVSRPAGDAAFPSVQRSAAGEGPEQVRRTAAGEAPQQVHAAAGDGRAGSQSMAAAPLAQRSPAGGSGPASGPGAAGRPADAAEVTPAGDSATLLGEGAGTVSRLGTEAFPTGLGPSPVGPQAEPGTAGGGEHLAGGPPPPAEGLPLAGTPRGDAPPARWAGGAADPGAGAPAPVQTFVPSAGGTPPAGETPSAGGPPPGGEATASGDVPAEAGVAALLGGPATSTPPGVASSQGGPAAGVQAVDPAGGPGAGHVGSGGPDLPVVARLTTPATSTGPRVEGPTTGTGPVPHAEASTGTGAPYDGGTSPVGGATTGGETDGGPGVAGLVGGDGGMADPTGDAGPAGVDPDGSPPPPLPLVVARLVGDRPTPLLTGAGPVAPLPDRPTVQRVTWQRDEATAAGGRAATTPDPERAVPVDLYPNPAAPYPTPTPAAPYPATAPGTAASTDAASSTSAAAGGGLPPVQRWVGALPGTPSAGRPPGRDTAPPGPPLSAYAMGELSGPVVQRAEPVDDAAPPPPVDAPAPPAAAPPPDGGGAAAGQPAVPGAPRAAGGGAEPEELLKKLYDPLLRRLKTELRLDRERHGALGGPG